MELAETIARHLKTDFTSDPWTAFLPESRQIVRAVETARSKGKAGDNLLEVVARKIHAGAPDGLWEHSVRRAISVLAILEF